MTEAFFVTCAAIIVATTGVSVVRVMAGKTAFDRVLAAAAAGTHAIALLAIIGVLFARPGFFVDLAITYALLNFIFAVAVSKYLERQREEGPEDEEQSWTS